MSNLTEKQIELLKYAKLGMGKDYKWVSDELENYFPEAFAELKEKQHSFIITIDNDFDKARIEKILDTYTAYSCYTIKELPELYTEKDMKSFAGLFYKLSPGYSVNQCFEKWKDSQNK
jgi:hypothetical protein